MNDDAPSVDETGLPMTIAQDLNPLPGVFAFLDASLPECLRKAAVEKNFGIGRLAPIPSQTQSWQHILNSKMKLPGEQFFIGYVVEGYEREAIAKVLNATFRLQWKGCPLRPYLAKYRLYHRDDMADALASAYLQHKRGGDPEAALLADYALGFRGLLFPCDIEEFKNAPKDGYLAFFWNHLRPFYEDGDRIVKYESVPYDGYLLVRGDRLVWEIESIHKSVVGVSLNQRAKVDHFKALGGSKAFLNGEFNWPPPDWVNPVSDEEDLEHIKITSHFRAKSK